MLTVIGLELISHCSVGAGLDFFGLVLNIRRLSQRATHVQQLFFCSFFSQWSRSHCARVTKQEACTLKRKALRNDAQTGVGECPGQGSRLHRIMLERGLHYQIMRGVRNPLPKQAQRNKVSATTFASAKVRPG